MKDKIDIEELWLVTIRNRLGEFTQHVTSDVDFAKDIGSWASELKDQIKSMTVEIFQI